MDTETTGVALIGRILQAIAAEGEHTASSLAQKLGTARATTYGVLRQLEAAGLIDRDSAGRIAPGEQAAALGFAGFGLAPVAGAVAPLLSALRDDTNAGADLMVCRGDAEFVLAHRPAALAANEAGLDGSEHRLETLIREQDGTRTVLRLMLPPCTTAAERCAARRSLDTVAAALRRTLQQLEADQ